MLEGPGTGESFGYSSFNLYPPGGLCSSALKRQHSTLLGSQKQTSDCNVLQSLVQSDIACSICILLVDRAHQLSNRKRDTHPPKFHTSACDGDVVAASKQHPPSEQPLHEAVSRAALCFPSGRSDDAPMVAVTISTCWGCSPKCSQAPRPRFPRTPSALDSSTTSR